VTDRYIAKIHGSEHIIGPEAQFRTLPECVAWIEASGAMGDRCIVVDDENSIVATYARCTKDDGTGWYEETNKGLTQADDA